ncbi:unnamed protein product [Larinioides sclopetarius]|uniref:Tc1-like transposase DDE domain-containing protein n=1 Tax=Larinioides sclopetarius TaxID=280406 RepID=A0AAV2B7A4_9ARAC
MDWPVQSPDLNPIEKLWDELDHFNKGCSNHPKPMKKLTCLLQAEWKSEYHWPSYKHL